MEREKVIKGLECCLGSNDCDIEPEEDCPYKGMCLCAMALRLDILAMLKEQEAVTIKRTKEHGFGVYGGICPKCRNWIQSAHSFCGFCGQAVKWE